MTELQEHDIMQCRSCGQNEQASEGYPCMSCGTFLCLRCTFRGIVRCATCEAQVAPAAMPEPAQPIVAQRLKLNWPEH